MQSDENVSDGAGVTIVIPAYNYAAYLAEALKSALSQDYKGQVEILVIDDGSTDETRSVVDGFGICVRYHFKDNEGLSAARNTGLKLASYDWVLFLDADDVLESHALRMLIAARDRQQSLPVVIGSLGRKIDAVGNVTHGMVRVGEEVELLESKDFILKNRFAPIVLADRRALIALGGFDNTLRASEDRDMWIRAATIGKIICLNSTLYLKREHESNMSRQAERQTAAIHRVIEKAANDPDIEADEATFRAAHAICLFQSARMYLSAGDPVVAIKQCLRSIKHLPLLKMEGQVGLVPFFRLRFLVYSFRKTVFMNSRSVSNGSDDP